MKAASYFETAFFVHDFPEAPDECIYRSKRYVTHPLTGNGYATQLIAPTVNGVLKENRIPYLQVAENKALAVGIYGRLDFKRRRKISFGILNGFSF
jgi:hypothetical protein